MGKEESAEEEGSKEEEGSGKEETPVEEEIPSPKKKNRARTSRSSTRPLARPIFEISFMTKDDIIEI